ncbi:MAG TPA: hypothetical protein VK668_21080 [Mucilaginibacter sp.]|nr:hypothetical protein [Mucilaginibacter sp.]
MKPKIFKPVLFIIALLAVSHIGFAQESQRKSVNKSHKAEIKAAHKKEKKDLKLNLSIDLKDLDLAMNDLNVDLHTSLNELNKSLNIIVPKVSVNLQNLVNNINLSINDDDIELSDNSSTDNSSSANGGTDERIKSYSKSYAMDANDKLEISNKFGRVVVNTWNKNEVKVDVQIKAIASDDGAAQKMIDAISISDSKDGNVVSFKTNFGNNSNNNSIWNLFNNRNDRHKAEVNYTIYMPSKNALEIDNRYGATELPDFDGQVEINSAYGSFSAKALPHSGNDIKVRYGSASIESLSSAEVNVSYGSLDLGSVDKLNSDVNYSSVKIGKIKTSGNIDARYAGGIQIDELDRNFTSFTANASYSSIKIGLNNATAADFDITVHYGGFDYNDLPVEITRKTPADSERGFHPTQNYKGHIGKGNAARTINISSRYGGVKFE